MHDRLRSLDRQFRVRRAARTAGGAEPVPLPPGRREARRRRRPLLRAAAVLRAARDPVERSAGSRTGPRATGRQWINH